MWPFNPISFRWVSIILYLFLLSQPIHELIYLWILIAPFNYLDLIGLWIQCEWKPNFVDLYRLRIEFVFIILFHLVYRMWCRFQFVCKNNECYICLCPLNGSQSICTYCHVGYHSHCLRIWLSQNPQCCICRKSNEFV